MKRIRRRSSPTGRYLYIDKLKKLPRMSTSGYYRQLDETTYCTLLACINALIFYGGQYDVKKEDWRQKLIYSGALLGYQEGSSPSEKYIIPISADLDDIIKSFGLRPFAMITSLENITEQINKGRCIIMTSDVGDYHTYLVIGVKGTKLQIVNYLGEKGKANTISYVDWKDLKFSPGSKHKQVKPSPKHDFMYVVIPNLQVTTKIIKEMNIKKKELNKAIKYDEGRESISRARKFLRQLRSKKRPNPVRCWGCSRLYSNHFF